MTPVERAEYAVVEAMIDHGPDGHVDGYEIITRAALTAALDVDELAVVIDRASDTWWNDLSDDGPSVGEYGAAAVKAWLTGDESDE